MGLKSLDYSKQNTNSAAEYKFSKFHDIAFLVDDANNPYYTNYEMDGVYFEFINIKRIILYEINNELQHYASLYLYGDKNDFRCCVRFQPEYYGVAKKTIDAIIAED